MRKKLNDQFDLEIIETGFVLWRRDNHGRKGNRWILDASTFLRDGIITVSVDKEIGFKRIRKPKWDTHQMYELVRKERV